MPSQSLPACLHKKGAKGVMTNLIIPLLVLVCLTTSCGIGGSEKTIADYTKAIEIDPDDPNAYINRGNAYDSL